MLQWTRFNKKPLIIYHLRCIYRDIGKFYFLIFFILSYFLIRYCGPGTRLDLRLSRNDPPINGLDAACKNHDIFYSENEDVKQRHIADKVLANEAYKRMFAKDSSFGEKAAAFGVANIMKAKVKLGMGLNKNNNNNKNFIRTMEKIRKTTQDTLKVIEESLQKMGKRPQSVMRKRKQQSVNKQQTKKTSPFEEQMDVIINEPKKILRKRKLEEEINFDTPLKQLKIDGERRKLSGKRKRNLLLPPPPPPPLIESRKRKLEEEEKEDEEDSPSSKHQKLF